MTSVGCSQKVASFTARPGTPRPFPSLSGQLDFARKLHGVEHTNFAQAMAWLAIIYQAQGRYGEAEPL